MKNSKRYLKFLIMIIGIFASISISYAYASFRKELSAVADVTGVGIDVRFKSNSETQSITAEPTSLEVGINSQYIEFEVSSATEAEDVYYEIDFKEVNNTNYNNDRCLMIYLTDEKEQAVTPVKALNEFETSEYNQGTKVLYADTFSHTLNKTFRLRMWFNENCGYYRGNYIDYKIVGYVQK